MSVPSVADELPSLKTESTDYSTHPLAPTFAPTDEEFKDALTYIKSIAPIAQKYGIVKIRPPPSWQPPFAIDIEKFTFTPRLQHLNELEAKSRIRLNFLESIVQFWHLQGQVLKIPFVEGKPVDLYLLHSFVKENGGYDKCSEKKLWGDVAKKLNLKFHSSSVLKAHYCRLLLPYDLYQSGKALEHAKRSRSTEDSKPEMSLGESHPQSPPEKDSHTSESEPAIGSGRVSRELKRLQFYGGVGKKMAAIENKRDLELPDDAVELPDPMDNVFCNVCSKGDNEDQLLLCDRCDQSFHTFCLLPPLKMIPKGDWRCPQCVKIAISKPNEGYGFQSSSKSYTLQSFGLMAEQFKEKYFNMPAHSVPLSTIEKEFWRIVDSPTESVIVEYGADILTSEMGSGFPRISDPDLTPEEEYYAKAPWNINNLPVLKQSVLSNISTEISGMKIPWAYVGMCFSTFCWHTEDHWTYSINYLHWGEPKIWYGVPGGQAEKFENVMKEIAPELFKDQPDLLHQLVTIMNPQVLIDRGVQISTIHQHAGEFVITFPRSYHAGFNQGFNFAEAVNFAPADWIPIGRDSIAHYATVRRLNVFAHDELICKIASDADHLELGIAAATYRDMLKMLELESEFRQHVAGMGVSDAARQMFELIEDDQRQCYVCRTTCFLSALICSCFPKKLVCQNHAKLLTCCDPVKLCLRYRYTLEELKYMLQSLKKRIESFEVWENRVRKLLACSGIDEIKPELQDLRSLLDEAKHFEFPHDTAFFSLQKIVKNAEKCAALAKQLFQDKIKTRNRKQLMVQYTQKLNLVEVEEFEEELRALPCQIPETDSIGEFIKKVKEFEAEAKKALKAPNEFQLDRLQELFDGAVSFGLQLEELPPLKKIIDQRSWLEMVEKALTGDFLLTIDQLRQLIDDGVNGGMDGGIWNGGILNGGMDGGILNGGMDGGNGRNVEETLSKLQHFLNVAETNEDRANAFLQSKMKAPIEVIKGVLDSMEEIPVVCPNVEKLEVMVDRAEKWMEKFQSIKTCLVSINVLDQLSSSARSQNIDLEPARSQIEHALSAANTVKRRISDLLLKPDSELDLNQVLYPRADIPKLLCGGGSAPADLESFRTIEALKANYTQAIQDEMVGLFKLRMCPSRVPCYCNQILTSDGIKCALCLQIFHINCIKSARVVRGSVLCSLFICGRCHRTKRPSIDALIPLLTTVDSVKLQVLELALFRLFVDRMIEWQRKTSVWQQKQTALVGQNQNHQPPEGLRSSLERFLAEGLALETMTPELRQLIALWHSIQRPSMAQLHALEQIQSALTEGEGSTQKRKSSQNSKTQGKKAKSEKIIEHERCADENCLQPVGAEVTWVQCEGNCQAWFHIVCIGMSVDEANEQESYICKSCR